MNEKRFALAGEFRQKPDGGRQLADHRTSLAHKVTMNLVKDALKQPLYFTDHSGFVQL